MKLILHSCCAPCSIKCVDTLRQDGIEPTVFGTTPIFTLLQNIEIERTHS